jgi:hypothetical protein
MSCGVRATGWARYGVLAALCLLAHAAMPANSAQPSGLDTSFGNGGRLVLTNRALADHSAVKLDEQGRLYINAICQPLSQEQCITRYLPNGNVDTTYGTGGSVSLNQPPLRTTLVAGMAVFNKRLTIGVGCEQTTPGVIRLGYCTFQFDENGTPVATYGGGGTTFTEAGAVSVDGFSMAKNGAALLSMVCDPASLEPTRCLRTFDSSGARMNYTLLHPSVGGVSSGMTTAPGADGSGYSVVGCKPDGGFSVCVRPYSGAASQSLSVLTEVPLTGGSGGSGARDPRIFVAYAATVGVDGKLLVAGVCTGAKLCIKRFNTDLTIDTTWAPGSTTPGTALLDTSGTNLVGSFNASNDGLIVQDDGRVVFVTARTELITVFPPPLPLPQPPPTMREIQRFAVYRLDPSGRRDQGFANDGNPAHDGNLLIDGWNASNGPNSAASSVAITRDGALLIAGGCKDGTNATVVCVAKLNGGPLDFARCNGDVDGDGLTNSSNDSLILSRVALGFTGSAVIANITFASHATRQTWPAIRDYLFNQCGMAVSP